MDLHGALSVPANARLRGEIALEDWSRVDIDARGSSGRPQDCLKSTEFLEDDVVIVESPGVTGETSGMLRLDGGVSGIIIMCQNDDRPGSGKHVARITTPLGPAG
jgi:hypothetical protein